jgi:alkanesulfonate monooxygenase SsuD/methylene tetrahydromethanopterin reductase-like flavin-dependent oxidoreductase (luciferase family)
VTDPIVSDRPFKLGFLAHVHGPGRPAADVYRDLIETFTTAEALGFDGGWVAQHHLRDDFGRLPSPHVFLAAVAAVTSRIELGTAVTVLPLEDPLRLAEDVAVLDALSGGRVQLGLGSGGANAGAFGVFGQRPEDRHRQFDASLSTLRGALEGAPLIAPDPTEGSPPPPRLQPAAAALADRLWQSTSDTQRARRVAERGDGLLLGTAVHDPWTVQRPLAEVYLSAWSERPAEPSGSERQSARKPRIGVVRAVFPAADRRRARDDLAPALDIHRRAFVRHGLTELAGLSTEEYLTRINVHYGHHEEVTAGLRDDPALFGLATYFIPVVQHELSSLDDDLRRLELIATEIAPALGWRPDRELAAG